MLLTIVASVSVKIRHNKSFPLSSFAWVNSQDIFAFQAATATDRQTDRQTNQRVQLSHRYWQTNQCGYSCHTDTDREASAGTAVTQILTEKPVRVQLSHRYWQTNQCGYSSHSDADRQTDKRAGAAVTQIQTDRQTDKPVSTAVTQVLTDRQTSGDNGHTDTDRQTDRQTNGYSGNTDTDRQRDKPAGTAVTQILTDRYRQTKPGGTALTQIMTDKLTSLCCSIVNADTQAMSDGQTSYDVIERHTLTDKPRDTGGHHADTDRLTNQKVRSQTIKYKSTEILYWQKCTLSGTGALRRLTQTNYQVLGVTQTLTNR